MTNDTTTNPDFLDVTGFTTTMHHGPDAMPLVDPDGNGYLASPDDMVVGMAHGIGRKFDVVLHVTGGLDVWAIVTDGFIPRDPEVAKLAWAPRWVGRVVDPRPMHPDGDFMADFRAAMTIATDLAVNDC